MFIVPLKVVGGTAFVRAAEIKMIWPRHGGGKCDVYFYNQDPLEVLEDGSDVMVKWYAGEVEPDFDEDDEEEDDDSES